MLNGKFVTVCFIVLFAISACNAKNELETPVQTMAVQAPIVSNNPYPIQGTQTGATSTQSQSNQVATNSAYPEPGSSGELPVVSIYPQNFIRGLEIPSPNRGMAVITGQLKKTGDADQPFLAAIFLAPVISSDDPNSKPKINYSRDSNPIATQDLETGRFFFADVNPGLYAIVVWTPGESAFLNDSNGNPLIIDGKADETNDLGSVYFQ